MLTNLSNAFFAIILIFLYVFPIHSAEYKSDEGIYIFSGYAKSYALGQDSISIDNAVDNSSQADALSSNFQSQNALRLMADYLSVNHGNFEIDYEIQPLYFSNKNFVDYYTQDDISGIGGTVSTASNYYRYKDLDAVMATVGSNAVILQNLDRFNYQYSNQYGDLTIGRQVVSFGSARFINPTDVFIPFAIQTLNQEYRVGIDAIRYKADVGDFAVIDAGIVIGAEGKKENSAAFLRGKNSIIGNDIEIITILFDEAWLLGGGIERSIGDFGFWFETAYMDWHQKEDLIDQESINSSGMSDVPLYVGSYWRTSIGSDYALNENIIAMLEYHYNGAGSDSVSEYTAIASQAPYQKAGVYLYGEHYIIPALTWMASPLLSVSASAFYNLSDGSVFLSVSSETSWSDNLYSDFGLYMSHGESLQYQTTMSESPYALGSEFGAYPLSLFASLRYYF